MSLSSSPKSHPVEPGLRTSWPGRPAVAADDGMVVRTRDVARKNTWCARGGIPSGCAGLAAGRNDGTPSERAHPCRECRRRVLGAERARVLVADYALVSLQELGEDGPTGERR